MESTIKFNNANKGHQEKDFEINMDKLTNDRKKLETLYRNNLETKFPELKKYEWVYDMIVRDERVKPEILIDVMITVEKQKRGELTKEQAINHGSEFMETYTGQKGLFVRYDEEEKKE